MISKQKSINRVTYLSIILLFLSSQSYPDNKFSFITYLSLFLINFISFLKLFANNLNQSKNFYFGLLIIGFLSLFIFTQSYDSNFSFFKQFIRIIYPWYLTILFIFTIRPYEKDRDKLFKIISFSSLALYLIVTPDIFSIIFGLLNNPSSIFFLKGYTVVYPEANTTAFFILFNIIFRTELKLAGLKENIFIFFILLLTISRSSIAIYFIYFLFKATLKFFKNNYKKTLEKYFSRILPLLSLSTILIMRFFMLDETAQGWQLFSFKDASFKARLSIVDYLNYFIDNINLDNFYKLFFGFGWQGKSIFYKGVTGTSGHTLPGMIPELGLIYIFFIFIFFYYSSWKGQLAESLILSLSLTIFIPISYVMPVFSLILLKNKFLILNNYYSKSQYIKSK